MLLKANGHRLIEHGGSWQGFKTCNSRYVDGKLTIVFLANLAQGSPERFAHGIPGLVAPRLVTVEEQTDAEKSTPY